MNKSQAREPIFPNFKMYYEVPVGQTVGAGTRTNTPSTLGNLGMCVQITLTRYQDQSKGEIEINITIKKYTWLQLRTK
jgi:hypothetical protein